MNPSFNPWANAHFDLRRKGPAGDGQGEEYGFNGPYITRRMNWGFSP